MKSLKKSSGKRRGITKKAKVHQEHNPKKTFVLGTGQADVLTAEKGLQNQVTVPSFHTSKQYSPTVLKQSCLENFMTQFTLFSWALAWLSNIGSQRPQFKALVTHAIKLACCTTEQLLLRNSLYNKYKICFIKENCTLELHCWIWPCQKYMS